MGRGKKLAALLVAGVLALAVPLARADGLAGKLLAQGRIDDAIMLLQSRITTEPAVAESYNLLCRAYLILDNWDASVSACEKAVKLEPGNSAYHLWLGRAYGEKAGHSSFITAAGLAGKVRSEFETAVRLDPRSVESRSDLADFYIEAPGIMGGGKDKAAAQAREIAKFEPSQAHLVTARIAEKKKEFGVAEAEYRTAIRLSGGSAGTWLSLAGFYHRTGRLPEMEAAIVHATDPRLNRPDVLMDAAQVLISAGRNLPGAAELLRRYLKSPAPVVDAPVFKAHYLLGTVLERQGDQEGALQQYRAAVSLARSFSQAQNALHRLTREMDKTASAG